MNRIFFTVGSKPRPQKRHSPQRAPKKVWHLIAQAKALGVKLVSVMNRDPSKDDKVAFNLQSRRYAPKEPIVGPVLLYLVFYMPVPKDMGKARKRDIESTDVLHTDFSPRLIVGAHPNTSFRTEPFHTKRPDVDNLLKLVKDALNGLMWVDDSQVQIGGCLKIYSHNPRTEIEIFWG